MISSPLINYTLHLADNTIVMGHRNSEWTGHGPILEQDIALSNIALDLVGQARNFYQYAAEMIKGKSTEDSLAFLRGAGEFKNCLLAEQENGDWGKTILRQFFFSAYQYPLYQSLASVQDKRLAAIAEKSLKEVTYHLRWSSEWVIRLGQGTTESYRRMNNALNDLWMYTEELITPSVYEKQVAQLRIGVDVSTISDAWHSRVYEVLGAAGLVIPQHIQMMKGGKHGRHTDYLQRLLKEMQYMQRTYPGVEW
jgi:ring-1,2-phenylacetyl-CoA epoxidase subunit PaaC